MAVQDQIDASTNAIENAEALRPDVTKPAEIIMRKAIQELVQLNEGHACTCDRAALMKMQGEALATARPASPR